MQKFPRLTLVSLAALAGLAAGLQATGWLRGADDSPAPAEAAAGAAPAAESDAAQQAAELLQDARRQLFSYSSVRANLREFVALGDRRFTAEGTYVAGGFNPGPQLRLEYQVRVGDTVGTLLEVCDGQVLHTQRSFQRLADAADAEPQKPEITVTRRDVRAIVEAMSKHGDTPETLLQAQLGLGGLPALLTSIERTLQFERIEKEQFGGRPCYRLQGKWKPAFLAQLEAQLGIGGRNVPSFIPDSVRIHFDEETLFPVRITYWPAPAAEGPALPPLLTLEFTDIRLNEAVNPMLFEYVSTGADETDVTKEFVEAIEAAASPPKPTGAPAPAPKPQNAAGPQPNPNPAPKPAAANEPG